VRERQHIFMGYVVSHCPPSPCEFHHLSGVDTRSIQIGRPTIATLEPFLPGRDHSKELEELSRFEETQTEETSGAGSRRSFVCASEKNRPLGDRAIRLEASF
jgi:hypothetical protein